MSDWVCIANNPQSGVSTWMREDDEGIEIQTRQDVTALLDENMARRNVASATWAGDHLHSVAALPLEMVHDTNHYLGGAVHAGDDAAVRKFLNDSDNAKLRTKEGKL